MGVLVVHLVQLQAVQTWSQADQQRPCTVQAAGIAVAASLDLDQAQIALIVVVVGAVIVKKVVVVVVVQLKKFVVAAVVGTAFGPLAVVGSLVSDWENLMDRSLIVHYNYQNYYYTHSYY